jgi:hypothetical protein
VNSPYKGRIQFLLEGAETPLFHELEGTSHDIKEGDVIYLNDVGYKVERLILYLYDNDYSNPVSGSDEWAMAEELYKVYLSEITP